MDLRRALLWLGVGLVSTCALVAIGLMTRKLWFGAPAPTPDVGPGSVAPATTVPTAPATRPPPPPRRNPDEPYLVQVKTERPPAYMAPHVELDTSNFRLLGERLGQVTQSCVGGDGRDCETAAALCQMADTETAAELSTLGLIWDRYRMRPRSQQKEPEPTPGPLLQLTIDHCWLGPQPPSDPRRRAAPLASRPWARGEGRPRGRNYAMLACEAESDALCHRIADEDHVDGGKALSHACARGDLSACRRGLSAQRSKPTLYEFAGPLSFPTAAALTYVFEQCLELGQKDACPVPGRKELSDLSGDHAKVATEQRQAAFWGDAERGAIERCRAGYADSCLAASESVLRQASGHPPDRAAAVDLSRRACDLHERQCTRVAELVATEDPRAAGQYYRRAAGAYRQRFESTQGCRTPATSPFDPAVAKCLALENAENRWRLKASHLDSNPDVAACQQDDPEACALVLSVSLERYPLKPGDSSAPSPELGRLPAARLARLCASGREEACVLPEDACKRGDPIGCTKLYFAPAWLTPGGDARARTLVAEHCAKNLPTFCDMKKTFDRPLPR
jgi:hypothetical protein